MDAGSPLHGIIADEVARGRRLLVCAEDARVRVGADHVEADSRRLRRDGPGVRRGLATARNEDGVRVGQIQRKIIAARQESHSGPGIRGRSLEEHR